MQSDSFKEQIVEIFIYTHLGLFQNIKQKPTTQHGYWSRIQITFIEHLQEAWHSQLLYTNSRLLLTPTL